MKRRGAHLASRRIPAKMRTWENPAYDTGDGSFPGRTPFPTEWAPVRRIEAQRADHPGSLVFHRISLLHLLKEALQQCRPDGLSPKDDTDVFALALCFLRANDLVLGYTPSDTDSLEQLMAGLLPFYELIPQEAFPEDLIPEHLPVRDGAPNTPRDSTPCRFSGALLPNTSRCRTDNLRSWRRRRRRKADASPTPMATH